MITDSDVDYLSGPVDCIASGYEWICPHCDCLNTEIEYGEKAMCIECKVTVELSPPEHAY